MIDARAWAFRFVVIVVLSLAVSPASAHDSAGSLGQRLYLPVYSEIPHGSGRNTYRLAATLSFRNTDPRSGITILRADYYDSQGKLLGKYLDAPVTLGPLASHHIVVRESERKGGVGANFIVEWKSNSRVVRPLVQTIMLTTASLQGIAFVTDAVVIEELAGSPAP
jgi:hypothetical protein